MIKIEMNANKGILNIDAEGDADIVMTELSTAVIMMIRNISIDNNISATDMIRTFCDTTYESWIETKKEITRLKKYMNEVE